MKNVTIADVAREAGVSVTTISRYLNGNYKKMSSQTKQVIEKTIARLHYTPKTSARRMRQSHSKMVGVIVSDISNVFSSLLFKGIYDVLQPAGYDVILMNSNNSLTEEANELRRLFAQQVDGLILQPNARQFTPYRSIQENHLPLVTVDRMLDQQPDTVTAVYSSNFDATYQLGSTLQQRGYQQIISLSRTLAENSAQVSRITGFKAFANQSNLSYTNVETADYSNQDLQRLFNQRIKQNTQKTAVISLMGPLLFDLLEVLKGSHFSFPQDLGLISFDDWSWSQYVNNGIYLLQQQPDAMGNLAAQSLLNQIEQSMNPGGTIYVPVKTIVKDSI